MDVLNSIEIKCLFVCVGGLIIKIAQWNDKGLTRWMEVGGRGGGEQQQKGVGE